jgi:CheY-like chemotaxis protein
LAEDHPEERIPLARYLRAKGYDVVEVFEPDQAKESLSDALAGIPFDAVVLDLIMPEGNEMGGEEVLQFMRANGIDTPVIIATAYGYNGHARHAKTEFPTLVREILRKMFQPQDLVRIIETVCGGTVKD